jgi:hypothetical protein
VDVLPSSDTHERPARSARRARGFVPASGWISRTKGVPPLYAASSYGTGTTVVVDWTTVTNLVVVADWTIVVDRVPLV